MSTAWPRSRSTGCWRKEILIELDREKTAAAGLNIYELAQELGDDNFTLASGTVRDGSRKLLLRSVARFDSLEELENRIVGPNVRLKGHRHGHLRAAREGLPRARHEQAGRRHRRSSRRARPTSSEVSAAVDGGGRANRTDPRLAGRPWSPCSARAR